VERHEPGIPYKDKQLGKHPLTNERILAMNVPFVDLKIQYHNIKSEIASSIQKILDNASFIMGPSVEQFEKDFASMNGVKYCIGTSSGTDALHLALWSLGINRNHKVIVPVNTFIATAEAINLCGAEPVFVDCDDYFNVDVKAVKDILGNGQDKAGACSSHITNNESPIMAIIPVHLYGQPADMGPILGLSEKHRLLVVEDACQAHLAQWQDENGGWRAAGAAGAAGAFSFFPGKNLGAYGEAGAVITNDPKLYEKMVHVHNHGSVVRYEHEYIGHNYRMEGIQGAVLNVKLKYIAEWTKRRQENAGVYERLLEGVEEVVVPRINARRTHSFHLYVVRIKNGLRSELAKYLQENGVATGLHYPIPLHLQKAYSHLGYKKGQFPKAERFADEILSLPMYPELTENQIRYVVEKTKEFFAGRH
jgi:dTDP-4-amino-4,6-dideoxygalactose transaminase